MGGPLRLDLAPPWCDRCGVFYLIRNHVNRVHCRLIRVPVSCRGDGHCCIDSEEIDRSHTASGCRDGKPATFIVANSSCAGGSSSVRTGSGRQRRVFGKLLRDMARPYSIRSEPEQKESPNRCGAQRFPMFFSTLLGARLPPRWGQQPRRGFFVSCLAIPGFKSS